ncbi:MAG TPA: tetratricopeptide repeat protein, partial [Pyrinomonadaceae bacterium]
MWPPLIRVSTFSLTVRLRRATGPGRVFLAWVCAFCFMAPVTGQSHTTPSPAIPQGSSQPTLPQSGPQPSIDLGQTKINVLAFRIAAAASEADADAALRAESELEGIELARALLMETFRLRTTAAPAEKILAINLRLLRYTRRPNMMPARGLALRGLGIAYANLNRWDLAEKELLSAITFFRGVGTSGQQDDAILTYRDLASMYYRKGDYPKAVELYEKVRVVGNATGDKESVIHAYSGLAAAYLGLGRISSAGEAYDTAYRKAVESGSPTSINYLFQSALTQIKLGDLAAAYTRFRKVMAESASTPDRRLYIYSLLNVAWIHKQHAQEKKAVELYGRAISIADAELAKGHEISRGGYISAKAEAVNRLAEIHTERGDTAAAIGLYTGNLTMLRSASSDPGSDPRFRLGSQDSNRILEIGINRSLGELHGSLGNNDQALAHLTAALELSEKIGYEPGSIDTMLSLATHAAGRWNTQQAFSYVDRVQLLVQGSGRLDQLLKLRTITAGIQRRLNRPAAADLTFQEAIRISESLRSDVTMPDQRASYFSSLFAPFDEYIDFLMERHEREPDAGFDRKAFDVSERRRARALLDSLRVARA